MDTLVAFGGEIKASQETEEGWPFEGWLIVNDSPDLSPQRDRFTIKTQYDFEDGESRPVYYHHGLDPTMAKARIGTARLYKKDAGVWVEGEIRKRQDYLAQHAERIGRGLSQTLEVKGVTAPLFGLSSGAASHLVERARVRDGYEIKSWSVAEVTISPQPMEPRTTCVASVKAEVDVEGLETELGSLKAIDARVSALEALEAARQPAEEVVTPEPEVKSVPKEEVQQAMQRYVQTQAALVGVSV